MKEKMRKLLDTSETILFRLFVIFICAIPLFELANNNLGERTLMNCVSSSPVSADNAWMRLPIKTSCGYVYIYGHLKNSFGAHPYAAMEMYKTLASGKPFTIKATGITGMLMAYEITPTE